MNRKGHRSDAKNLLRFGKGMTAFTASSFFAASTISTATADTVCNVGNLEQLQTAGLNADCDIINITSNIIFNPLEVETQTVLIDHSALVKGNITIDGNRTGNVFSLISDYTEVTFQGLTIIDGGWDVSVWQEELLGFAYNGGAISTMTEGFGYVDVDIVLDGVTIENGSASIGGAVGLGREGTLVFTGDTSYFHDNIAYVGGAIGGLYLSQIELNNSVVFENNEAIVGGAVGGFAVNSISTSGGAQFKNNYSISGGAIGVWILHQIDVRDSYFVGNRAFNQSYELPRLGEYITFGGGYFALEGSGGAISSGLASGLRVENSTFFNNSADNSGGAIFSGGNTQVILSTFLNNSTEISAEENSGASIRGSGLSIFGCIFASDQSARAHLNVTGGEGGADLGGNFSTSPADAATLSLSTMPIVSFSDLKLSNMPSSDTSYLGSAPILQIENTSVAADALDLEQLSSSLNYLSFPVGRVFPVRDQRGETRSGKYDAGSFEIGSRAQEIIPILKKVVLPSAPARVSAKADGRNAIRVEWTLPTTAGTGRITKYEVYRNGLKIATVASNKRYFIDRGLDYSQSYTYRIVSVGTQGNSIKSQQSSSIFPRRILPTVNK